MTNKTGRYNASFKDQMKIHDFLKGVLDIHADGKVSYKGSMSDEGVRAALEKEFSAPLSSASVAHVRKQMFGILRDGTGSAPGVEALKDQVVQLTTHCQGLTARVNVLENNNKHMQGQLDAVRLQVRNMSR